MKYIANNDQSLLDTLMLLSPGSSKTTLRSWLKEGRVQVDGKIEQKGELGIKTGQVVELGHRKKFTEQGIQILYQDVHLVIVDKPPGVLSVSTAFEKGKTLHAYLKEHFRPKRVYVVHRLDQDASGVMVFAFTEEARDRLKNLFEKHDLTREYTAIVEGRMPLGEGTWESILYEDTNYHVHETENEEEGQLAITHYKVLKSTSHKRYSWLNLTLETGRKNQIRVHCEQAGYPIVGDFKYTASTNPIKRLCLHAHLLAFVHPITKKSMRFISSIPEKFKQIITLV